MTVRPSPNATRSLPMRGQTTGRGALTAKARSGADKLPRLARRKAPACRKARAKGLRFSARHPLILMRALWQVPDATPSRR